MEHLPTAPRGEGDDDLATARQLIADLSAQLPARCSVCLGPRSAHAHADLGPGNTPMGSHPFTPSAPIEDLRRRAEAFLAITGGSA